MDDQMQRSYSKQEKHLDFIIQYHTVVLWLVKMFI